MSAFIIIAACLVCLDRMFFRGQLLSLFINGMKGLLSRRKAPASMSGHAPAPTAERSSLVVSKRYANGPTRPRTAKPAAAEQSVKEDVIFAPNVAPALPQMRGWSELTVQPAIGEDGEIDDPEEPVPTVDVPTMTKPEIRDPEVVSMLETIEAGERVITGDATEEEMRAIENFDLRAYV